MVGDTPSVEDAAPVSPAAEATEPKKRARVPKNTSGAKKTRKAPAAKKANKAGGDATSGTPTGAKAPTASVPVTESKPRGRPPKAGDNMLVEWSHENKRWEATKDGQLMMYKNTGDKKWMLVEDTVDPVADSVAQGLRAELLNGDWEVLKGLSAAALREMCEARENQGLKVQGDNKKRDTEEKQHTYYLNKLLKWLKDQKVLAKADTTEEVEQITEQLTEQLQSAPREPAQAPLAGSPQAGKLKEKAKKEAEKLANSIMTLELGDREMIKNLISTFQQKKKKFEAENALRIEAEAENARLQEEVKKLKAMVDKCPVEGKKGMQDLRSQLRFSEQNRARGFMSRKDFRIVLEKAGLLTTKPGNAGDGQDVFHIIASSNGGPDHVDNYLYALGAGFNRSIGAQLDHVCCYLAGKDKARCAARIALAVANDSNLHIHIDTRTNETPTLFTEGHKDTYIKHQNSPDNIGEDLYNQGAATFGRFVRQDGRDRRKSK